MQNRELASCIVNRARALQLGMIFRGAEVCMRHQAGSGKGAQILLKAVRFLSTPGLDGLCKPA